MPRDLSIYKMPRPACSIVYLVSMITTTVSAVSTRRHLRFAYLDDLVTARTRTVNFGPRSFSADAPRPVEGHSGARKTIFAGPYHNLIPLAPRSRRRRIPGGYGEGCYAYLGSCKKKPSYSAFLSDGPQMSSGSGKLSPSPLSTILAGPSA